MTQNAEAGEPGNRRDRDVPADEKPESRDDAAPDSGEVSPSTKKERVIHTRVPAVLDRELKRFAQNLRIPVSNLIRTILEDAVSVADAATENVEQRLKKAASHLEHERERLRKVVQTDPLADVFAFQPVKLAVPAACAKCGKEMKRGESANLGLSDAPKREGDGRERVFVCDTCLPTD